MVTCFPTTRGCSRRPAASGPFWQHPQHSGWVDRRQRSQRLEWWSWLPRPSEPLSSWKDRYTPGFKYTWTTSNIQDDCHYCSVSSSVLVCSSRRLLGKRPGHSRVQQRVPEAPAPVWPRTRLSSPGQVGESTAAVAREKGLFWALRTAGGLFCLASLRGVERNICSKEKQQGFTFVHSWFNLV